MRRQFGLIDHLVDRTQELVQSRRQVVVAQFTDFRFELLEGRLSSTCSFGVGVRRMESGFQKQVNLLLDTCGTRAPAEDEISLAIRESRLNVELLANVAGRV